MTPLPSTGQWQKLWSSPAYRGFVTVNRDTYMETNGTISDWDIIAGYDTAAMLAFTSGGEHVVLFEQYRVGPGRTLMELPGGYLNPDESPMEAAGRELAEETGFQTSACHDGGFEWWAANSDRRKHIVIGADARLIGEPSWDASESGRVHLLPSTQLIDFLLTGDLTDAGLACRGLMSFAASEPRERALAKLRTTVRGLLQAL